MSTTTTNYGLIKPDTTDPILIGQLNDNADAIDAALKENADAIENKPDAADIPTPSTAAPAMDGTAAAGTSTNYARADHVHPSDTSKQDALSAAQLAAVNSGIDSAKVEQIETNKNNISWNYTETRFTNTGTSSFENTGVSFTAPANQSIEFYAYDRKDSAYLDKILVCDSLTTIGTTTIVSANSIIDGFTDEQYWTLQTSGITPTYNTDVTYYIWIKRKSTGSNPIGLAWRYLSR